jgi:LAS superfamily LD-carboxypeptidase LdcB
MSKLKLINILKNKILEQAPIGFYDADEESGTYYTSDEETGKIEKVDVNAIESEFYDDNETYEEDALLGYHERAKKDKDDGITNPNLISDIIKALKIANISAEIHYSRDGHGKYTSNGNISRHWAGNAVDLSFIDGVGNKGGDGSNKGLCCPNSEKFMSGGDKIVDALKKLGYSFGEGSNVKGYLWRTDIGGNHWNHVHVSNSNRELKGKIKKGDSDKPEESKKLPSKVKSAIDDLKNKWGVNITQAHIDKEFEQEGDVRPDNGGVNTEAEKSIKELIRDCNNKFGFLGGVVSGYRSYSDQVDNFGKKVKVDGRSIENVQASNTIPGFSQHHTGKAFDIFSVDPSWWDSKPEVKKWVADNAIKYGFEITYKTNGVLRIAEPWHLFYVGGESDEDEKTGSDGGEKKTISKASYIIDLNNPESKNIGLVWGGTPSSTYGASFMKKQGENYFTNKNIIYSDHENSLSDIKKFIKKELGDGYTINSVSGFSKGAEKTWGEINGDYDFVGLIDPSTSIAKTSLPSNVKMMSNHSNWSYYPNMLAAIKTMEKSGLSERVGDDKKYNHLDIPKIFFEKYSSSY